MIKDIKRQLLDTMLKIRMVEEKIVEVYAQDQQMRTPTHISIGQEAVAAGLVLNLKEGDQIFTSHRCHAAYLAKNGDFDGFFAELCGRAAGVAGGRSGSAHLTDHQAGIYASPILGAMIPVAAGAALSFKMDGKDNVAVSIFGDATVEEGVFAETLNFAVTKELPLLFLCENNLYSTHTPLSVRQPPSAIVERVRIPELEAIQIDGNDVFLVYETLSKAIAKIRQTKKPIFIECLTYRVREHVGPLFDYDRGYRSKKEVEAWMAKCPVKKFISHVIEDGIMSVGEVRLLEAKWKKLSDDAYAKALSSPWPLENTLLDNVY